MKMKRSEYDEHDALLDGAIAHNRPVDHYHCYICDKRAMRLKGSDWIICLDCLRKSEGRTHKRGPGYVGG